VITFDGITKISRNEGGMEKELLDSGKIEMCKSIMPVEQYFLTRCQILIFIYQYHVYLWLWCRASARISNMQG
jgi:hypothetical protein